MSEGPITAMSSPDTDGSGNDITEKKARVTLGNVRLRNQDTNALILIPAPSADPNDPLNW